MVNLLKKLPSPDQERLVYFDQGSHTVPDYRDWLERVTAFEEIVAQHSVGRNSVCQTGCEGCDIVDPLADLDAGSE